MRSIVGFAVGVAIGILATLAVQRGLAARETAEAKRTVEIMDVVPVVMERALPGVKVLDVALQTPPTHEVSYHYDELYDTLITYQLTGRIKRVNLPFGRTKGTLVFPSTTEIVVADDKADVIDTLSGTRGVSVQPDREMQRARPAKATEPRR